MTIDQLLGCSTLELEAMSDEELREHCQRLPGLNRPASGVESLQPKKGKKSKLDEAESAETLERIKKLAAEHGLEI